ETLRLVERPLVRIEAEPGHAVEDRLQRLRGRALQVGVLDPQHEDALVVAGVGPGVERGARPADMQETRGAGSETGAYGTARRSAALLPGNLVRHGWRL